MSNTARLVAVCHSEDYPYERRQIPLVVDDNLTMVVQFNDSCVGCDQVGIKPKELERFVQKYHALTNDEVAVALMVTNKEIMSLLSQMVPCVGCRRSVERLFAELVKCGYPALEPLIITSGSILSIKREYLFDPKAIYALFYVHGSKLTDVMESIPKSKKNKRCVLHSLDSHKQKSLGSWMDIWEVLSQDCRDEVVLIECDTLMDTLENYLRKHRFCSECKSKVLRAYSILTGEVDSAAEKGYCPQLYDGLRCCPGERHIHVKCETDFIAHLIGRAEPELTGSRRERHAKTLDIAQEEVLTCLGVHLYERLHKIWQKLRAEEQTWQLLFFLGADALRKNFEVALEKKQGISNLELMCEELLQEEKALELKREQRRQKRKKKKNKNKTEPEIENETEKENCSCDGSPHVKQAPVVLGCENCDDNHNLTRVSSNSRSLRPCQGDPANKVLLDSQGKRGKQGKHPEPPGDGCAQGQNPNPPGGPHRGSCANKENDRCDVVLGSCTVHPGSCTGLVSSCGESVISCRSDCGYSSGHEGCESCSVPSSNDGSDIACTEGVCNHDGDSPLCARSELNDVCRDCMDTSSSGNSPKQKHKGKKCTGGQSRSNDSESSNSCYHRKQGVKNGSKFGQMTLSLQDMLEAPCSSGEEEDAISEEEIQKFKANQKLLNTQRAELRATLKKRFANMQQRHVCGAGCNCTDHPPGRSQQEVDISTSTVGGVEMAKAKVTKVKDVTSRVTKLSMN